MRHFMEGERMAAQYRSASPGIGDAAPSPEDLIQSGVKLRVMLVDIKREIETPDSFAIKFSILTKTPLPKVKHMIRTLPVTLWKGEGRAKAERILSIIDEAGGKGSIEEETQPEPASAPEAAPVERPVCRYCGFPLKEGDTRCEFCMTTVTENRPSERHSIADTAPRARIPRTRLVMYICLIVAAIIAFILLR
jgi:hypothetical protein